jgi:hypothetical protein
MSTMSVCGIDYEVSPMCTVEGNVDYFLEHGEPTVDEFRAACVHVGRVYAPHLLYCLWCENLITVNVLTASIGGIWSAAEFPDCALDRATWRALFDAAGYTVDGRAAEQPTKPLLLFRGSVVSPAYRRRDWSWTDDIEVARRFAAGMLGREPGVVWQARVAPWRLLARNVNSRPGESEYVIDTHRLRISHADRDQDAQ